MQLKSIFSKRVADILFIAFNLSTSAVAITAALYLRFPKASALRYQITHVLGFEGRAALEHLLVGYGLVVFGVMFFGAQTLKPPGSRQNDPAIKRFRAFVVRWQLWVFSNEIRAGRVLGGIYLFGTVCIWEVAQAYIGADGLPARGYIQWEQIVCDIMGVALAVFHLKLIPSGLNLREARTCPVLATSP